MFSIRIWLLLTTATWISGMMQEHHHKQPLICTEEFSGPQCDGKLRGEKLSCRESFVPLSTKELLKAKNLSLCHWSESNFSPTELISKFPNLHRLSIRDGNVTMLVDDFPRCYLQVILLTDLQLQSLPPSVFSQLVHLRFLDLSRNKFKQLDPEVILTLPAVTKVNLTGNPWHCTSNLSWILDKRIQNRFADQEKTTCDDPYIGKPITHVLSLLKKMEEECPWDVCSCSMPNIVWSTEVEARTLLPVIAVNCSHRALKVMPETLPSKTKIVHLEHNEISDLSPLIKSRTYAEVWDVYLTHNKISNIDMLEGSDWLNQFRVLSLKANYLTEIPTYAMDHAFEMNQNLIELYLGKNPWTCSCDFTPGFQHLLIKYGAIVRDIHEIKCHEIENSEHSLMQVMELSKGSVCYEPETSINPLDILSGILATLIILVLGKLVYDYWNFKRTGKLPWIVAKMP